MAKLLGRSTSIKKATTNSSGFYQIINIPAGAGKLDFKKAGYTAVIFNNILSLNLQEQIIDISMNSTL